MSGFGFLEGSMGMVVWTGGLLILGFVLERILVALRWPPYFRFGFAVRGPLDRGAVPPAEEGRNVWLHWTTLASGEVMFWSDARTRRSPAGLHGVWIPGEEGSSVGPRAYWAPPWTPVFASFWLMALGASRGDAVMTTTIGVGLLVTIGAVYSQMARRAVESWGERGA